MKLAPLNLKVTGVKTINSSSNLCIESVKILQGAKSTESFLSAPNRLLEAVRRLQIKVFEVTAYLNGYSSLVTSYLKLVERTFN